MKETVKMSRAIGQLEKMYREINKDFFENELPMPIITVQSKPGTFGHCTINKVWKRKEEYTYELNIAAEVLESPIEEIIDTIIHEMCHMYCRIHDIKETSRGTAYHNRKFKEVAEAHGLTCYNTGEKYGWNTKPGDNLIEYALQKEWSELMLCRSQLIGLLNFGTGNNDDTNGNTSTMNGEKKPSSTRKYQCPKCKNSVRATKVVNIICGDCNEKMIKV